MPWRCTALEDLDDDHATAAAWTTRFVEIDGGCGRLAFRFCNGEQLAGACDVVGATAFGEQPVVADAVQALGQHVDEEAADELIDCEYHDLLPFALLGAVVLPFECHAGIVDRDQATVGDCHAVGVARQIGKHGFGSTEWLLAVDDPFGSAQRCQIRCERLRASESGMRAKELQAVGPVCNEQLSLYQEVLDEFTARGATLYGVSVDNAWSLKAFREKLGTEIEQLSDFEPKGETCRAFGVYHPGGFPQRALVIIGPDAVVRWSYEAPSPSELPGANLIFDGLAGLPAA